MKKNLLDVIFASDKRKNVLLFLQDGPQEMRSILNSLRTTRQALLPQVRVLEEHKLLRKDEGDVYELTVIGKLVVSEMLPLLDLVDALDENIHYWGTHDLSFIPPHLLKRLDELQSSTVIEPDLSVIYEINRGFMEKTRKSKSLTSFTTFLFPNYASFISEWRDCGVDISLIITKELFEKLKIENTDYLRKYVTEGYGELFVYDKDINVISFSQNDYCLMFRLFTKEGNFDNKLLMIHGPKAFEWGKELFEYYKQESIPITQV
ncbi:winged helix-turn-helix domain-containing protein [Methanolobus sp. ZRKC2]|uniref:helix-turn-helix transcriptional regulator n=1 Tax=Methanolobus sp. ZRKC2 TaxID=3125783 RepID=UPI00324D3634